MTDMKRVYHPSLDSWQDVPAGEVDAWAEAGWRKTAPKHVTTDGLPEVGTHPGYAQIPVLEDVSPVTDTPAARSGAGRSSGSSSGSSGSRASGGSRTGRGSAASASTSTTGGTSTGATTV